MTVDDGDACSQCPPLPPFADAAVHGGAGAAVGGVVPARGPAAPTAGRVARSATTGTHALQGTGPLRG
jgi:hypothetical protein